VLLARALAQATPVLLLDEPTTHLDLKHQMNLLILVKKLAREKGLAVLMAMHDLNLVSAFADKAALMVEGELKAAGSPEAVLTEELIRSAYDAEVDAFRHPETGMPVILGKSGAVDKS
jgi:iron complex transport system ATP-binding protein